MKFAIALLLGLVTAQDSASYIPPYTEDETFMDDEEYGIDIHDNKDESYEMFPDGRPETCYGLALSDSINLGPYQAGVIQGLIHELGPKYEVISGVSLGAINAHIIGQYKLGHEQEASKRLEDFWTTLAERN